MFGKKHKNITTRNNIKYNYQFIENWFNSKSCENLEGFVKKIENNLQFVIINVSSQDEAFQLFDSQNSRGKPLYPVDLLKAFHLREMENEGYSETELEKYSTKWENYILDNKRLNNILGNHLFRIRKWVRGDKNYNFSKSDIKEFKGISLSTKSLYNYDLPYRILEGFSSNAQNDRLLRNFHVPYQYPFQLTMPIVNGKNFFDYVFHYLELNDQIFKLEKNKFNLFYKQLCFGNNTEKYLESDFLYQKNYRSGDVKVRNLFENICLLYVDRFGIDNFDKIYFEEFYKNSYQLRLDKKSISDNSILKYEKGLNFFKLIPNSYTPEELHSELFCNYSPKDNWSKEGFVNDTEDIYKFLKGKK